jgi:hypothetical protein
MATSSCAPGSIAAAASSTSSTTATSTATAGARSIVHFEVELPPLTINIPREQYIVETRRADRRAIRQALMAPPVEQVERVYALEEVRYSERLRDKMPGSISTPSPSISAAPRFRLPSSMP